MSSNIISQQFWNAFLSPLGASVPVYFTFHRNLIEDIVTNIFPAISRNEALQLFLKEAREFLDIKENRVRIKNEVYSKSGNNNSKVILLIALQVLAVEEMIRKENDFTEDAYFPKLRNLISDQIPLESLNPFDQN